MIGRGVGAAILVASGAASPAQAETRVSATETKKCATCRFWGGSRSISADGKWVLASGTGTCNNPKSPAYGKQTKPTQGAPVWERWEALG